MKVLRTNSVPETAPCAAPAGNLRGHRRNERGIVAVELAILLPVLLIAVLGAFEFSRLYLVERDLAAGARMAARTAVVRGASVSDVDAALATYFAGSPVANGYQLTTSGVSPTATPADRVTVSVDYQVALLTGLKIPGLSGGFTVPLSASVTMRHQ
ncbi:MAG: Flp pilus assembly protein TadG [Hyphomicrobiaceae bacterium]|jgi:Flp pilus assembly protein TadG